MSLPRKRISILLVEDNPANVFLQKRIIEKLDCADRVVVARTGQEAYERMKEYAADPPSLPDLVFLDINLPAMNGWEFMELYNQLEIPAAAQPVVLMLTYSNHPNDKRRAAQTPGVSGFYNKPLTVPLLNLILEAHFPILFEDH
ncbi:CheY-like chemotaxis protein [Lewinella aquimaris]|uniref:CheY-like chemotaxis protein n=1 Tax=Neolewinella aquimaris TaxID=1835722 RepID=A0A840E885_9BACT|nr:response regulator [Neolewinella aquimaris]MBB4079517.1 CheY-like chemotaxis protein [Neolewinella aquimaris]